MIIIVYLRKEAAFGKKLCYIILTSFSEQQRKWKMECSQNILLHSNLVILIYWLNLLIYLFSLLSPCIICKSQNVIRKRRFRKFAFIFSLRLVFICVYFACSDCHSASAFANVLQFANYIKAPLNLFAFWSFLVSDLLLIRLYSQRIPIQCWVVCSVQV